MSSAEAVLERLADKNAIAFARSRLPVAHGVSIQGRPTLHYLDWSGTGDTIVFLHGGALTAHTWDLVCLDLGDKFHCIALDLRGHGLSDWSDDYSIDAHVGDVEALARHLRLDSFHLVGMSLGGNVAAHYAAAQRSRARSLVMVDVGPWVDFESTAGMREFMTRPIADLTVEQLTQQALKISVQADRDRIFYRYLHMTHILPDGTLAWRNDRRRPHDFPHMLAKLDQLAGSAPQMPCPVLIVRGGRSRVLTDEKVERFANLFERGSWTVIPDAGHNVQEDTPKILAATIRKFLAG